MPPPILQEEAARAPIAGAPHRVVAAAALHPIAMAITSDVVRVCYYAVRVFRCVRVRRVLSCTLAPRHHIPRLADFAKS